MKKGNILFTTNLSLFKMHKVNRKTDDSNSLKNIKAISEDMKKNGFRPTAPIVVTKKDKDGKHYIIDGQHRCKSAEVASVGVYYIIDDTVKITNQSIFDAFVDYNDNVKVVRKSDFINGYAEMGKEEFIILENFGQKYPMFTLTERMMLLQNSGTKHPPKDAFRKGKFEVANVKTAEKWAEFLLQLKPYFEKGYNKSQFVRAILTIAEKKKGFNFEEFIHKVRLRPGNIFLCGDKLAYSHMIHNIYNYRRRDEDKLDLRLG